MVEKAEARLPDVIFSGMAASRPILLCSAPRAIFFGFRTLAGSV